MRKSQFGSSQIVGILRDAEDLRGSVPQATNRARSDPIETPAEVVRVLRSAEGTRPDRRRRVLFCGTDLRGQLPPAPRTAYVEGVNGLRVVAQHVPSCNRNTLKLRLLSFAASSIAKSAVKHIDTSTRQRKADLASERCVHHQRGPFLGVTRGHLVTLCRTSLFVALLEFHKRRPKTAVKRLRVPDDAVSLPPQ